MKLMIVGAWRWPHYESGFAQALKNAGVIIYKFSTSQFFNGWLGNFQLIIPVPGPSLFRMNRALIREVRVTKPDAILFWRPTHVLPSTISKLNKLGIGTISYNNDDPYGPFIHSKTPLHHRFLWFWYHRCIPLFNLNFFYRKINCQEAIMAGARHADVLLPYFLPWQDRPVILSPDEILLIGADVVFVGHYESDGREKSIRALFNAGINVKIWGGDYWTKKVLGDLFYSLSPIIPAEGDDYAKVLCSSNICLAFLSKLNRDSYTRRCFEIPACGRVMLAERTDDLMKMFKDNEEACFFSSNEELVAKAKWLLENPDIREQIAKAGMNRVWADGHDINSRVSVFLNSVKNYFNSNPIS